MIPENYIEKTYAGWVGKVIGIRMGAPIENWSKEKIELIYGKKISNYLVDYQDFACDDDSNGPLFFVRGLEHYKHLTPKAMGYTFLNYIAKEHGFFWWGNELSTEHTAYKNLLAGIDAPESGSAKQNGKELAEQIGGQIFIDCFGFVAPGNPKLACELAECSARVTHDLEGVSGARFIAACISLAYVKTSIIEIMNEALAFIPEEGSYYQVVSQMIRCKEDGLTSEEAFMILRESYWVNQYPGVCHIIPNAGIIALALAYGENNYAKTMQLVNLCGFDTDCNAGNVGAIMGVLCGIQDNSNADGIPKEWITPIRDIMLASSISGSLNISTLSENTLLFCKIGYQLAEEKMPDAYGNIISQLYNNQRRISHFEFPEALHGFRSKAGYKNAEISLSNSSEYAFHGKRGLKITINNLHPFPLNSNNKVYIYQKTYYTPDDLHDARYQPCFSPIAYPGDRISCQLKNITGQKLKVSLYCYDLYHNEYIRLGEQSIIGQSIIGQSITGQSITGQSATGQSITGQSTTGQSTTSQSKTVQLAIDQWVELKALIPHRDNSLIKEVGIEIVSMEETDTYFGEQVCVIMDQFSIMAQPSYQMDFACIPIDDYTLHGVVQRELSGFTLYNSNMDHLQVTNQGIILSGEEKIYTGDYCWKDYKYQVKFELLAGNYFDMLFRNQGILRSYVLRISHERLTVLYLFEKEEHIIKQFSHEIECNKEYNVSIDVRNNTVSIQLDESEFYVEDLHALYETGCIGIQTAADSRVRLIQYSVEA